MKEIFKVDGIVYRSLYILYQLMVLNILWVVCSLPLITIGASTTALYYVIGKIIRKEEVKELVDFIKSFKENFKTSTLVWLILCGAYLIIFMNLTYFSFGAWFGSLMFIIQIPIFVQLVIINVIVFPLISRYEVNVVKAIKVSWILGNRHILSVAACIFAAAVVALATKLYPPLFVFLFISFTAMVTYLIMFKTLEKNYHGKSTTLPGANA